MPAKCLLKRKGVEEDEKIGVWTPWERERVG